MLNMAYSSIQYVANIIWTPDIQTGITFFFFLVWSSSLYIYYLSLRIYYAPQNHITFFSGIIHNITLTRIFVFLRLFCFEHVKNWHIFWCNKYFFGFSEIYFFFSMFRFGKMLLDFGMYSRNVGRMFKTIHVYNIIWDNHFHCNIVYNTCDYEICFLLLVAVRWMNMVPVLYERKYPGKRFIIWIDSWNITKTIYYSSVRGCRLTVCLVLFNWSTYEFSVVCNETES